MNEELRGYRCNPKQGAVLAKALKSKNALQLYVHFLWKATKYNYVNGTLKQLQEETGIDSAHISRALKELAAAGIIKKKSTGRYMLNPKISYEGGEKMMYTTQALWDGEI